MSVSISLFAGAGAQFFDSNGVPLAGGLLYTYAAGTTTPQTTYTTSVGNIANSNPIVLDSAGRTANEVWLTNGSTYKFVLKTSTATQIGSYDNIPGANDFSSFSASSGSSLIGFIQAGTGAVATTVQTKLRESVSILDFGATTDSADNATAIQAALTAATGGEVIVPAGNFTTGAITIPAATTLRGAGGKLVAKAAVASLITLSTNARVIGLKIDASTASNAAIYGENIDNIEVSGNWIKGGGYGVRLAGTGASQVTNIRIENNYITTCVVSVSVGACVLLEGNASYGVVVGNTFTDSTHGFEGYGSNPTTTAWTASNIIRNITVTGNVAQSMTGAGFFIVRGEKCVFSSNVAETCGDLGFDFEGCWYCSMTGNIAKACVNGCYGIYYYCHSITLSGNTAVINNAAVSYVGIFITGVGVVADVGFQDINIIGNVIEAVHYTAATLSTGIYSNLQLPITELTIKDNVLRDCSMYIRQGATYVTIRNNNIHWETFTGKGAGIYFEGTNDFTCSGNNLIRDVADSTPNNGQSGITTTWVSASYLGGPYEISYNTVRNWTYSITDASSTGGQCYGWIKDNRVSGQIRNSATVWVGVVTGNVNYSNPNTPVTATTY